MIAFGKTKTAIKRDLSEFKRKDINVITNIPDDPCVQAVHLAPSGINFQPWYFKEDDNKIIVYEEILKALIRLLYNLTEIDLGIALCHYESACTALNRPFNFRFLSGKSDKKGYKLFGEITAFKTE